MAERLEDYEFSRIVGGRPAKYPWEKWLDGSTWRITRGADFNGKVVSMRKMVAHAARGRDMRVETQIDGDSVIFRATPKTP